MNATNSRELLHPLMNNAMIDLNALENGSATRTAVWNALQAKVQAIRTNPLFGSNDYKTIMDSQMERRYNELHARYANRFPGVDVTGLKRDMVQFLRDLMDRENTALKRSFEIGRGMKYCLLLGVAVVLLLAAVVAIVVTQGATK
jgi:hypothetical protein